MPEDEHQHPEAPDELETDQPTPRSNAGLMFLAGVILLAVAIYFGIAQGFVALVMFPGIPLVLLWFVYWVFLRRIIRARKIRGAQERRLMREAAQRGSRQR